MKKLFSVAVAASLFAGISFADVNVGANFRMRSNMYSTEKKESGKTDSKLFNLKRTDFNTSFDYLYVKANNDFSGLVLESNLDVQAPSDAKTFTIDNYYGWLNFGALKITAGAYDSRFTNRFNTTITEDGLLNTDITKWGVSNKLATGLKKTTTKKQVVDPTNTTSNIVEIEETSYSIGTLGKTWLYDFGNVADLYGGNNLSFIADYTFKDVADGILNVKAGIVTSNYDSYTKDAGTNDEKKFEQNAGYIAEVAWKNESLALDFIFKNPQNKAYGAALYGTYNINKENTVAAGVTFGTQKDIIKNAIAAEGRYKYSDGTFGATLVAKYSTIKADKDGAKNESALELGTEISYVLNDTVTLALDGRLDMTDLDNNDEMKLGENTIVISPRARFSACKNASITAAVEYTQALNSSNDSANFEPTKYKVTVPVVFRVLF